MSTPETVFLREKLAIARADMAAGREPHEMPAQQRVVTLEKRLTQLKNERDLIRACA